jgi:outer membrane protein OmpA-like peptidoglycan-associated protein
MEEGMMTGSRLRMGAVAVAALVAAGCAVTRENQSACKAGATVLGALVGGAGAGVAVGETTDDEGKGAGAGAGGAVLGGLVGYLLGNHFCEVPEVAAAPPPPAPAPVAKGRVIETLAGPNFAFNKATLTASGREHADHAAQVMRAEPTLRASLEGHTDSVGSDAYNLKLSKRRAEAVRDYLVSKGIAASRLTTEGYGESKPVASNDTAEGRAQNRRVEIIAR